MLVSLAASAVKRPGTDRCPGSIVVHQAQDGGLARIRVPGGALPVPVFEALARWSAELGTGRLELTARGNLQLRGLAPGAEVELSARLSAHGLLPSASHDRVRNIVASPLSGLDGLGALDVRPLVAELDRRICADPALAALPGRFLFAIDDGRGDVAGLRTDVAVLALPEHRVALLLGGLDSGLRPPVSAAVHGLLSVATLFLRRRPDERTWRVDELPGGQRVLLEELRGLLGPDVGAGTEVVVPERGPHGPVGPIEQADGRVALAICVPLGELTPTRCRLIASVAHREIVLTPWRGLVLPNLSPPDVDLAVRRLIGAGLVLDPASPALGVSACAGRPGCASALADVRSDAAVTAGRNVAGTASGPGAGGAGLPVHWSGCARRCGRPSGAVVDVVAGIEGYQVLRDDVPVYCGPEVAPVRAAADRARERR
ncbi:MAG: precorrin-3B synthase [Pseudonocardia sp.]